MKWIFFGLYEFLAIHEYRNFLIGGSIFVTGFDVDVLSADGPDMGDILVDSLFTPPPEFGESIPRKLYNYFFGSKDSRKYPVVN